jgi:hypothetical protein
MSGLWRGHDGLVDHHDRQTGSPASPQVAHVRLNWHPTVPLLDRYLEFLAFRSRPNTVLAVAYDLKVFFTVGRPPHEVSSADVLGFVTAQHTGGGLGLLQPVAQCAVGVAARTVRRRLTSVSGWRTSPGFSR